MLSEDEASFQKAVRLLCNYSLVDLDVSSDERYGSGGYSIHGCVHSWTVSVLNKEWDEDLAKLALTCIASEIPSLDERNWWLLQRRLLSHAMKYENLVMNGMLNIDGMEWALHNLGLLSAD